MTELSEYRRHKFFEGAPEEDVELALEVCETYNLNPALKHVILMSRKRKAGKDPNGRDVWETYYQLYVTRDGLVQIAHNSGIPWSIQFKEPRLLPNPYLKDAAEDIWLEGTLKREGYPDYTAGLWFSEYAQTWTNEQTGESKFTGTWASHPGSMHQKVVTVYLLRHGFAVALPALEEVQPDGEEVKAVREPVEALSAEDRGAMIGSIVRMVRELAEWGDPVAKGWDLDQLQERLHGSADGKLKAVGREWKKTYLAKRTERQQKAEKAAVPA